MTVQTLTLADRVWAALDGIGNVNSYDGQVPDTPPLDPDGRVHGYLVFYPSAGQRYPSRLGARPSSVVWGFQVTCVGGDRTRCLWVADKVTSTLGGLRVDVGDGRVVRVRELSDNQNRPVFTDTAVTPTRSYLPLSFALSA